MHSAALSIKAFGVYVILTGLTLAIAPNALLAVLGLPLTTEIWIRVVGVLAAVLGYYYWACAVANTRAFFRASLAGRIGFCAACISLVLLAKAPWQLLLFGAVDVLGATWTALALRQEAAS